MNGPALRRRPASGRPPFLLSSSLGPPLSTFCLAPGPASQSHIIPRSCHDLSCPLHISSHPLPRVGVTKQGASPISYRPIRRHRLPSRLAAAAVEAAVAAGARRRTRSKGHRTRLPLHHHRCRTLRRCSSSRPHQSAARHTPVVSAPPLLLLLLSEPTRTGWPPPQPRLGDHPRPRPEPSRTSGRGR